MECIASLLNVQRYGDRTRGLSDEVRLWVFHTGHDKEPDSSMNIRKGYRIWVHL